MFTLDILESPSFIYSSNILDEIVKNISKNIEKIQSGTLNIIFLDETGIQNLNKNYRNIDTPTDVLSFHYYDDFSELTQTDIAGELVLCEAKIISQGQEFGLGTEHEFYKLVIHSILHVLGYDHETDEEYEEMKELEEKIWGEVFDL